MRPDAPAFRIYATDTAKRGHLYLMGGMRLVVARNAGRKRATFDQLLAASAHSAVEPWNYTQGSDTLFDVTEVPMETLRVLLTTMNASESYWWISRYTNPLRALVWTLTLSTRVWEADAFRFAEWALLKGLHNAADVWLARIEDIQHIQCVQRDRDDQRSKAATAIRAIRIYNAASTPVLSLALGA